jgi:hypothetical protein
MECCLPDWGERERVLGHLDAEGLCLDAATLESFLE